jgi:hypothetical protein
MPWWSAHLGPKKPSHLFLKRRLVQLVHEQLLARFQHVLVQRLFMIFRAVISQYLLLHARRALWIVHAEFDRDRIGN